MFELDHHILELLLKTALLLQVGALLILSLLLQAIKQSLVLLGLATIDDQFYFSRPLQDQALSLLLDLLLLNHT